MGLEGWRRPPAQFWFFLAAPLLAIGAPVGLVAQTGSAVFDRVPHGTEVRIQLRNRSILFGRFAGGAPDSIALVPPLGRDPDRAIPLREITGAWFRRGWQTTKGLSLGIGVGLATGALVGAIIGADGDLSRGQMMVAYSLTLGIAGGLSGMIAGGLTQRWERVWPPRS